MTEKKSQELSRRKFLRGAGTSLAGVALAGSVGVLLAGCESSSAPAPVTAEPAEVTAAEWPFNYKKLDPDVAAEKAYNAYKEAG